MFLIRVPRNVILVLDLITYSSLFNATTLVFILILNIVKGFSLQFFMFFPLRQWYSFFFILYSGSHSEDLFRSGRYYFMFTHPLQVQVRSSIPTNDVMIGNLEDVLEYNMGKIIFFMSSVFAC